MDIEEAREYCRFYHHVKCPGHETYDLVRKALLRIGNNKCHNLDEILRLIGKMVGFGLGLNDANMGNFSAYLAQSPKRAFYQEKIIPFIARTALKAETLFPENSPSLFLLQQDTNAMLNLPRIQARCILALMFFGLMPAQNSHKMPRINNFSALYRPSHKYNETKITKLDFLFSYFEQELHKEEAVEEKQQQILTICRRALKNNELLTLEGLASSQMPLCKVEFEPIKKIEEVMGQQEVDFANRFIGGAALDRGAVQEEIRFMVSLELSVACSLCEMMLPNESLALYGFSRTAKYKGYGHTLAFDGVYQPTEAETSLDDQNRLKTALIAIDAIKYKNFEDQFTPENLLRELNKAYCGFLSPSHSSL